MRVTGGKTRRLIVNADDFGLTLGVNRAIREAHRNGILTSTTVLVAGLAADGITELVRDCPELSIGLHVNFTFSPVTSPARIRTLVDDEGEFLADKAMLRALATRKIDPRDVYREVSAQIDRLKRSGVTPSHWDAHRAVAFWPGLCAPRLAQRPTRASDGFARLASG